MTRRKLAAALLALLAAAGSAAAATAATHAPATPHAHAAMSYDGPSGPGMLYN